jgi:prolipoprotein diacylglyceryltransferase
VALHIPSPPVSGLRIGPLDIHVYGLMYVVGITLAVLINRRRWSAVNGDPALVADVAIWAVRRASSAAASTSTSPRRDTSRTTGGGHSPCGTAGLGIWGGVALAAVTGAWRVRRAGADTRQFMDAVGPALLVAQAIGRIGNYFNQELFGGPTSLPWGLQIAPQFRPAGY